MPDAAPLTTCKSALAAAIALCGGQAALARLLSRAGRAVSQQRIWNAVHRDQSIPAEWCLPIEKATGGQVTCRDLRPDIYPGDQ